MAADDLRSQGNLKFAEKDFFGAAELYTKAIELAPERSVLYSNRSACHFEMNELEKALEDGRKCVALKRSFEKGHFRCGVALEKLGRLEEALAAFREVLKIQPTNPEVRLKAIELGKIVESEKPKQPRAEKSKQPKAASKSSSSSNSRGSQSFEKRENCSWAEGLSTEERYEWLMDCYRMRIDDDYVWGEGYLHGLYAPVMTKSTVVADFFVFCTLAAQNQVVPAGWEWSKFVKGAVEHLPYAFSKSTAQEKYGTENFFSPMFGGRSLRFTGDLVYQKRVVGGGEDPPELARLNTLIRYTPWEALIKTPELFKDIGGVSQWKKLHEDVEIESTYG